MRFAKVRGLVLDLDAVVHLVRPERLCVPAAGARFVVSAHDQRLDRLGRTDLSAQTAEGRTTSAAGPGAPSARSHVGNGLLELLPIEITHLGS